MHWQSKDIRDLHSNASAYSKHKTESTMERKRKKDKWRTESDLVREGGRAGV